MLAIKTFFYFLRNKSHVKFLLYVMILTFQVYLTAHRVKTGNTVAHKFVMLFDRTTNDAKTKKKNKNKKLYLTTSTSGT